MRKISTHSGPQLCTHHLCCSSCSASNFVNKVWFSLWTFIAWSHFLSRVQNMILLCRHLENLSLHSRSPRRSHHTQPGFPLDVHTSVDPHCLLDSYQHVSVPGHFQHRAFFLWIFFCNVLRIPSWGVRGWQPVVMFLNKHFLKRGSELFSHDGCSWKHKCGSIQFLLSVLHTVLLLSKMTVNKTKYWKISTVH